MNEQEIIQDVPGYLTRVGMFYLISKHQEVMYQTRGMFHLISKQITLERVFYLISKQRRKEGKEKGEHVERRHATQLLIHETDYELSDSRYCIKHCFDSLIHL